MLKVGLLSQPDCSYFVLTLEEGKTKKFQSKITDLHSLEISETRSIFNLMIFCVPKVYLQNTAKAEREARLQGAFNWDYSNLAFSVNTHTSKAWILFYFFLIHSDSSGERN